MTPADFRAARLRLGLSQTAMGKALGGYDVMTVCRWEIGKHRVPAAVAVLIGRMTADFAAAHAPGKATAKAPRPRNG